MSSDEGRMARRARWIGLAAALITTLTVVGVWSSCGEDEFNLYKPVAEPLALRSDPDARLEQARVLMDQKKYDDAAAAVEPVMEDKDSNDARLLYAAAQLGVAGLDVWTIIRTLLEATESTSSGRQSKSSGGMDALFDSIGDSVLGTGAARQAKINALSDALATLADAPDPDDTRVQNTACVFAGIMAVPLVADAKTALETAVTALESIRDAASSGGAQCPNLSLLTDAQTAVNTASVNFSLVLNAASNCPFLDLEESKAAMNQVEEQLSALKSATDKGCASLPSCPAELPDCQSLFPACVQEAMEVGSSDAVAGDGLISGCELLLNCTVPSQCFGG